MVRRVLAGLVMFAACATDAPTDPDFPDGYPEGTIGDNKADSATVTQIPYRGGVVLHEPKEVHVYWGSYWTTGYGQTRRGVLDQFAEDVGQSSWYAHVLPYGDANGPPGLVEAASPVVLAQTDPAASVSDRAIRSFLQARFADHSLAYDPEAIYIVFTPPAVTVTTPWGKSCVDLCGYHYHFPGTTTGTAKHDILYAVIPHLECGGCAPAGAHANGASLDAVTSTLSHEIAEAVTDPNCDAWTTRHGLDEVGDLCDTGTVATWSGTSYVVQDLWSNATKRCVH